MGPVFRLMRVLLSEKAVSSWEPVVVFPDVPHRKRTEERLRSSEERYRASTKTIRRCTSRSIPRGWFFLSIDSAPSNSAMRLKN